ncbi:hypothetical protein ACEN2I_18420 [Flavobacterium sp. W22_SRS_FK3]|uniref:hypothetical protein n=1 Tax=Flavobacterium sp. W22_SRS_FK3 TaxID=3240275 RepID=UPI003F909DD8
MKKSILITIAVLFSTIGHAKYYKAILYLVDGSPKTGLAELVEDNESKVYFRTDENAKTEKISSAEISKIVYTYESGQIITMEYLYLTGLNVFSGNFSKSKNKYWFNIVYDKEFKIGKRYDKGSSKTNNFRSANSSYFFEKKGSDDLVFGYNSMGNVLKSQGTDARMKKMSKEVFGDCPKISEAIEKETFTTDNALNQIIGIFDNIQNCK